MRILVLVHPDAIFETVHWERLTRYREQPDKRYLALLEEHLKNFDHVFAIFMYSPSYLFTESTDSFVKFRNWIAEHAQMLPWASNNTYGNVLFANAIGELLIDYPDAEVYFGGGYTNLCVAHSMEQFRRILYGVYDKQPKLYKPLLFRRYDKEVWQAQNVKLPIC